MANLTNEIVIIGGGIGGLAAALATAESGKKSVVLEQAQQFGEVGAGLQLGPNGMAVLDRFGLSEEIAKIAVFPKRLVLKDVYTGEELATMDLGEAFKQRYGHPYAVMHRSDLHRVLLEACEASPLITLKTKQQIEKVENKDGGVVVTDTNGDTITGKAAIGADGIWSKTRPNVSQDDVVPSGYVAYRGTLPITEITDDLDLDDVFMWIGPNLHLVQYPVRRKELYNQVVVFKSYDYEPGSPNWREWGTPAELERRFADSHPVVQHSLTFINRQFKWPMADRNPIENWTDGNITLLGDAAHPMLQYLAQGGVQALEDASYLADMLHIHGENYAQAFQEYQKERQPRSAKVQTTARQWGEVLHAEDPLMIQLRKMIFGGRTSQDYEIADWLYGGYKRLIKETVNA
ncbi:FAD-dependent monooxygenase [Bacillus benzoevorans]|uniref:Salicylate hydroxylase n=1 Tax=Bacillus benzoevorans TaxID=1456 RepID=A0A7X0LW21_9BACI|nr:FAD-dependent monooxygenase [Bacillus benzoevorans]MBB6446233.1 salicylate hydroxylase [Bacillus benzoevorans]